MENVRLPLMYEIAVFSSSPVSFIPSPYLPPKEKEKRQSKTSRLLVLFHLFPELLGYLILSLDLTFPGLVVRCFPHPH